LNIFPNIGPYEWRSWPSKYFKSGDIVEEASAEFSETLHDQLLLQTTGDFEWIFPGTNWIDCKCFVTSYYSAYDVIDTILELSVLDIQRRRNVESSLLAKPVYFPSVGRRYDQTTPIHFPTQYLICWMSIIQFLRFVLVVSPPIVLVASFTRLILLFQ
jgi:hypothetical protein